MKDKQERGRLLEKFASRLFELYGILIREPFRLFDDEGNVLVEQVDGAIEIDGNIYLVEIKWLESP